VTTVCLILHLLLFNVGFGCLGFPVAAELLPEPLRGCPSSPSPPAPSDSWCPFYESGLPDGLFSDQKSQFCFVFEGLGMENLGVCTYFMVIWVLLSLFGDFSPFGIFCGNYTYR
jgi:hypothetical protein